MYIDAHTHVQFHAFEDDYKAVITRALEEGVWIVNVGTQRETSRRAVEISREYEEGVYAAVGLHPVHTAKSFHDTQELGESPSTGSGFTASGEEFDAAYYKELAMDPKVVAIGECGLDYFRLEGDTAELKARQKEAFEAQIAFAKEVEKPLMIHCRDAFPDLINLLTTSYSLLPDPPGIIHFFTGTTDDAEKLLDLGFSFTFGGAITFARNYDEQIKRIPLDRILSETDAPYVAPVPYRGKRNEPRYVVEVVKKLAELKGVSLHEMRDRIFENAQRVLGV